jgi:hypothetical protein
MCYSSINGKSVKHCGAFIVGLAHRPSRFTGSRENENAFASQLQITEKEAAAQA